MAESLLLADLARCVHSDLSIQERLCCRQGQYLAQTVSVRGFCLSDLTADIDVFVCKTDCG
jgi:hypothetical protein